VQDNLLLTVLRRVVESRYGFLQSSFNNLHYPIRQTPEIRLYCRPISHFAPCTEVSTYWVENGSDRSHTLGHVARAGIRMILCMYNMYDFSSRQMVVPLLLTKWEEDNPSKSTIVHSWSLAE
jgi:hypothetical protein